MFGIILGVVVLFVILCVAMAWRMKKATHYRGPVSGTSQQPFMGEGGYLHHHHDEHGHHHQATPTSHEVHHVQPTHNHIPTVHNPPPNVPPTHTHH